MSYLPCNDTISHFIWRKRYLPAEENNTPIYMYKMVDHYLNTSSHVKNIQAFRGSGKSINTCILALDRVANGHNRFVMIVSDTMTQAEALIADIQTLCDDGTIPIKITRSVTGMIEFNVNGRPAAIMGVGAGMSLRGRKFNRMRADLVITDDLMNDQVAMNRLRMDRLSRWMFKVLIPSMNPQSELWNVGTPLNAGDIFMKMCDMHPTLKIPLEKGVWPNRFSDVWIDNKKAEYTLAGMLREFKQEFSLVLTDSESQLFTMDKVKFIDETDIPDDLTWFMTCDLAFSEKDSADYSALICNGVDDKGNWYVYATQGRWKPSETAGKIFELVNRFSILDVGIEGGASMIAVSEHLEKLMLDYQSYFNIIELKHGGRSKISRISALEPVVNADRLVIVDNGKDAEALVEQMELTDSMACMASHDDLIDALAYMIQMHLYNGSSREYTREQYQDPMIDEGHNADLWSN